MACTPKMHQRPRKNRAGRKYSKCIESPGLIPGSQGRENVSKKIEFENPLEADGQRELMGRDIQEAPPQAMKQGQLVGVKR